MQKMYNVYIYIVYGKKVPLTLPNAVWFSKFFDR